MIYIYKYAFFVSRKATRLKKLLYYISEKNTNILNQINFIITDNKEDNDLKNICLKLNIPLIILDYPNDSSSKNIYGSNFVYNYLKLYDINYDIIFVEQ
jgi:hypothetical protein